MAPAQATVLELPCSPASVAEARRLCAELTEKLMPPERCHDLLLALSEVVSNAVRHSGAREDVRLAMTPKDEYLCVQVTDSGAGLVPAPGAMETDPGAGFGLFLVERLTRRWGMTREGARTRVWFEMDYLAGGSGSDSEEASPRANAA